MRQSGHMSKTLQSSIKDWEMKNGFTARALERAARGEPIGKVMAFQIAKAVDGCSDEEARQLAEEQAGASRDPQEGRPAGRTRSRPKAKDSAKAAS